MFVLVYGRDWPFGMSQILEPKCGNFWDPIRQSVTVLGTDLCVYVIIYIRNCVYRPLEMKL